MGGGQTLNFGLAHLDTFAWIGAFSAAPNTKAPAELIPNPSAAADSILQLWISCGTNDGLLYISQEFHDYLVQNNVPHNYSLVEGAGHDWTVWKYGLYHFSQLLFKQAAAAIKKKEPVTLCHMTQNYPNPFNPITNISYFLSDDGYTTLKIYNLLGCEIETLVNEYQPKGRYDIQFKASNLAGGVYIYRLQAGKFTDIKKLILMK